MSPTEADWDRLIAALRGASSVLVVAHVQPDADAIGSGLALGLALRSAGIPAQVTFDEEPFVVPDTLAWLPGAELLIAPADGVSAPDVVVSVDCSSPDRLGRLLPVAEAAPLFAAIDHHASNSGFSDVPIMDASKPATGVLIAELLDRAGWAMDADVATNIYAAVVSDTGGFSFSGTTADTHRLAARLLEAGADFEDVGRRLFASKPLGLARLTGEILVGAQLDASGAGGDGLLVAVVTTADRSFHGVTYDAVEAVISDLANISDAEVAVIIKEQDTGQWKVSMRSRRAVNVGRLCADLGGGGHVHAAGYTPAAEDPDEVVEELRRALADPRYAIA